MSRRERFVEVCRALFGEVPSSASADSTSKEDAAAVLEECQP